MQKLNMILKMKYEWPLKIYLAAPRFVTFFSTLPFSLNKLILHSHNRKRNQNEADLKFILFYRQTFRQDVQVYACRNGWADDTATRSRNYLI